MFSEKHIAFHIYLISYVIIHTSWVGKLFNNVAYAAELV
jgi:hypothetical protein